MVRLGMLNSTFACLNDPKGSHRVQFDLPMNANGVEYFLKPNKDGCYHDWPVVLTSVSANSRVPSTRLAALIHELV